MIAPFPGIEVLFPGSLKWSVIILADEALNNNIATLYWCFPWSRESSSRV